MSEDEVVKYLYQIADEIQEGIDSARVPRRSWTLQKRFEAIGAAISAVRMQHERRDDHKTMDVL